MVIAALAAAGLAFGADAHQPADFRARNVVEQGMLALLIAAASIAILTTIGIVLSLIFNTIEFFRSTRRLISSLAGMGAELLRAAAAPRAWDFAAACGARSISRSSRLLVAVPIGLFAAIYLSEYASKRVRALPNRCWRCSPVSRPFVYGLFALLTVGPLLVSACLARAGALGVDGWRARGGDDRGPGDGHHADPVCQSSLSDDIINAVPQAMRDGSYGLGATQSETIRQVVLPAALPGIVGAILLAGSRAPLARR